MPADSSILSWLLEWTLSPFKIVASSPLNQKLPGTSVTAGQLLTPGAYYPPTPAPAPPVVVTQRDLANAASPDAAVDTAIAATAARQRAQVQDFFDTSFPADIGVDAPILPGLPDLSPSTWLLLAAAGLLVFVAMGRSK